MLSRLKITVPSVALTFEKKLLRGTMRVAGTEVAAVARTLIRGKAGAGRGYYGPGGSAAAYRGGYVKGRYQASAAGASPVSVTGTLARSIKVKPFKSGEGVAVRDNAFYALFLEAGARGGIGSGKKGVKGIHNRRVKRGKSIARGSRVLEKRPFLTRALEMKEGALGPRVRDAATQGIKLVRVKK